MTDCNDESKCPLYTGDEPPLDCIECMRDTDGDRRAHVELDKVVE